MDRGIIVGHIRTALEVMVAPGSVVEIRVLKADGRKRTDSGYFDDIDKAAEIAARYDSRAAGIYHTLNPVELALLARAANRIREGADITTGDIDIIRRCWLPIDFDPVRPAGISSSEVEHTAALDRAAACRSWLCSRGWPEPLFADSGNGAHLLYRVDLPNDASSRELVKACLDALAHTFTDESVVVDRGVHNAGRIWKLYGTLARKGDSTTDRPHRRSAIISRPGTFSVVAHNLLLALSSEHTQLVPGNETSQLVKKQSSLPADRGDVVEDIRARFDMVAYARHHFPGEVQPEGHGEVRITGNQGLLINSGKGVWKQWGSGAGGDCFDLIGHVHFGPVWNRHDANMFSEVLDEAAQRVGITNHRRPLQLRPQVETAEMTARLEPLPWELPLPFHEYDLPSFPLNTLGGWLRDYVEAVALETQTPADLAAMLGIAVCSAALSKIVAVSLHAGHTEPVNMYIVVALPPGNRKSSVFKALSNPIEEFERSEAQRLGPAIAEAQARYRIMDATLQKAQSDAARASQEERADRVQAAETLAREFAAVKLPVSPRLITTDATPEKLVSLLHDNGGRMAVMSPEGNVFDLMDGRYSTNGASNFDVYLNGYSGDTIRVDRIGRRSDYVPSPALTLGLTVQPSVIRGLGLKTGFRERGLLGRFMFSLPKSLVGYRDVQAPPVPSHIKATYDDRMRALLSIPPDTDETDDTTPHVLRLTPAAHEVLTRFAARIEPQLAEFGALGSIVDWATKLVGGILRIAGILHMVDCIGAPGPWTPQIQTATVGRAIEIGEYLIPHARAAFAEMGIDSRIDDARYVLKWIERTASPTFTKRDCFEGTKGRFREVSKLEPVLTLLVDHGYIRLQSVIGRSGPGRPSSQRYEVNPLWPSQNSHYAQNSDRSPPGQHSANSANTVEDSDAPEDLSDHSHIPPAPGAKDSGFQAVGRSGLGRGHAALLTVRKAIREGDFAVAQAKMSEISFIDWSEEHRLLAEAQQAAAQHQFDGEYRIDSETNNTEGGDDR